MGGARSRLEKIRVTLDEALLTNDDQLVSELRVLIVEDFVEGNVS
jgi:hypothetical protein